MPKQPHTTDITGQLVVLGTGTSVGIPSIGCGCDVCRSSNPKNKRTRCSVIWGLPDGNLLIDTPPDLRTQLLREEIGLVHAVAYTHEHTDHLMGMDDLRLMQFYLEQPVPLYCEEPVERRIRQAFAYAFEDAELQTHVGATPQLDFIRIGTEPLEILGAEVTPIRLKHGPRFDVLGFRIGNVAYCTDTNGIPAASMAQLEGLDVLILDALRHKPHVTHFCIEESLAVVEQLKPRHTYFTHICHDLEHEATNRTLPNGVELAFDGQKIAIT